MPDAAASADIIRFVAHLLDHAVTDRASDIHLEPTASGGEIRFRVDGLLTTTKRCDTATLRAAVNRFMVLAHLLTYRLDVPQEGRVAHSLTAASKPIELRVSVMPTTHGLRCAVRLPADLIQPKTLDDLGMPARALDGLKRFCTTDAGMLIVTGPAGSGKTTTIYALLSHLIESAAGLSIVALEDPVERDLPGVTQIEVKPFGELTYERCLRSILRQDPQVLMLGEIRDSATALLAIQAALSGHRLICTLHAATPGGAIARLLDMGVEPYQITSATYGILSQRLLRRKMPDGSYRGRLPVAEFVPVTAPLRAAILRRADASELNEISASQADHQILQSAALDLVQNNLTDAAEVHRIFPPAVPPHLKNE
jgi:general secretion pathway protein E